jgi:hypothetical protein
MNERIIAITALRQAIEQAEHVHAVNTSQEHVEETAKGEHEPVAVISAERLAQMFERFESTEGINKAHSGWQWRMGWNAALRQAIDYTAPPERKWVGLTEQDIKDCEKQAMVNGSLPFEQRSFFARAIEAKLKEKNT